ncbi:autotransporter assembly complex protein TamA [Pseudoalteromonas denitrificans]|uniref:Translocation and assembly module subunit TamA n=1 Tax=Pseudoalteromonas denitrificans DSM 6059 TaxID=1123010 RepID=A0A1I1NG08_9GAMM|nr:autotransporter secretion outer membrane protein TamA [Pseudoalteromonas denitrificans DSM 6059]
MLRFSYYFFLFVLCASAQAVEKKVTEFKVFGIEGALLENVSFYLEKVKNESATVQLKHHSIEQIQISLEALGYYKSQVQLLFEQIGDSGNAVLMSITIEKGPETRIAKLDYLFEGEGNKDQNLTGILNTLPLNQGEVINHGLYEKSKSIIDSQLLELGYFDAKWKVNQLAISLKENSAFVKFQISTGVRYHYGPIVIAPHTPAAKYIRSLARFKTGENYQASTISEYNLDLASTPYFKSVRVYADIEQRENKQVPIRVDVLHKPANSYDVGGGFSTDTKLKGRFKWTKPWVGSDGHYFENNIVASKIEQEFLFSYTIPVDDPIDDVWRYAFGYKRESNDEAKKYSRKITTQLQRQWLTESHWVRTAFIKHEREDFELASQKDTTEMLLPGISYARKRSRGGTTPYWGDQLLVSSEIGLEDVLSSTDLLKVQFQTALLRTYKNNHLFYARATLGAIWVEDIVNVPASMRFFAGGDQSIRGFAYESISPIENGEKLGGRYLATGTLEYNYQFAPSWRVALFVDGGTATNDFSEDIEIGAGFGLRWLTPVGPIRVDHAWAMTRENKTTRLSITIGPEI